MSHEMLRPDIYNDKLTRVFRYPLKKSAVPFVHLENSAEMVRWVFENPWKSKGRDWKISIGPASGDDAASVFTKVAELHSSGDI